MKAYVVHHTIRASDISRKKKQNFAGFSGANSQKNWPISRDFSGKKSNYEGFSEKNRPISREISGGDFAKKQSVKNSRFH